MFINPIGVNSRVNSRVNNSVAKKSNAVSQPSFKRENYMAVFDKEYKRIFQYIDGRDVGDMFDKLSNAAANIKFAQIADVFKNKISQRGLVHNMFLLRGFEKEQDYENLVARSEKVPLTLVRTDRDESVVGIFNNGKFPEDNIVSQAIRKHRNHDVDRRNMNIVFADLEDDRIITFGLDYNRDWYVARGDQENPVKKMHTFYDNGRIKEVIKPDGTLQKFNMDGSKWDTSQYMVSDAEQRVRNFIKLFTGWDL